MPGQNNAASGEDGLPHQAYDANVTAIQPSVAAVLPAASSTAAQTWRWRQ